MYAVSNPRVTAAWERRGSQASARHPDVTNCRATRYRSRTGG
ncbi:MAG TPA: hypothetical protein VHD63_00955 [Ktedonobacteraceae bacterium]|nr:hypothetical protein [Ktedonobacteraceae bacterium]